MAAALGTAAAWALPATASETVRVSGRAFGTSWHLRLRGAGDVDALAADLAALLERIDRSMSPFRDDSTLSRFNGSGQGAFAADPDLACTLAEALRVADLTGGAFDPSVGPDVGRYGFGPIHGTRVGSHASLSLDGTTIERSVAGITLDLCGIAKGYALDRMAQAIAAAGFGDFVAEIGGEVLAVGTDEGGAPWRIGIADPLGDGVRMAIDPRGLAVATSGDAVNAYEIAGRRYSHIIDPLSDEPVRNAVASVSVLAATAMTADALATALMVMGPVRGLTFAASHDLPVLYLLRGAGRIGDTLASPAFQRHCLA